MAVDFEPVEECAQRYSPHRIEPGQDRDHPICEEQPTEAAEQSEKHVLSKKLPDETPTSGTQRAP